MEVWNSDLIPSAAGESYLSVLEMVLTMTTTLRSKLAHLLSWMPAKGDAIAMGGILLVAVLVRILLSQCYHALETPDTWSYVACGRKLLGLEGAVHEGQRGPGFSLIAALFDSNPQCLFRVQSALGTITALIMYMLSRRLCGSRPASVSAALMTAVGLNIIAYEHVIASETLSFFLVTVVVCLALHCGTNLGRIAAVGL